MIKLKLILQFWQLLISMMANRQFNPIKRILIILLYILLLPIMVFLNSNADIQNLCSDLKDMGA